MDHSGVVRGMTFRIRKQYSGLLIGFLLQDIIGAGYLSGSDA